MSCERQPDGTFVCNTECGPHLVFNGLMCVCPDGHLPLPTADSAAACPGSFPTLSVPQCTITLSYAAQTPDLPKIVSTGPIGCDAGIELALAATLAALLKVR